MNAMSSWLKLFVPADKLSNDYRKSKAQAEANLEKLERQMHTAREDFRKTRMEYDPRKSDPPPSLDELEDKTDEADDLMRRAIGGEQQQ